LSGCPGVGYAALVPSDPLVPKDARRVELESLRAQLASRTSTVHFAHTGVSLVAAFIFTGTAAKLFWDSIRFPRLGLVAALAAVGLVIYAFIQYRRGKRELARELVLFESLKMVRHTLRLDDPASLLPR
jgi:hypothetical protein